MFPSPKISIPTDIPTFSTELNSLYKNIVLGFFEEHNTCRLFEKSDIKCGTQNSYIKMLFRAYKKHYICM